MKNKEFNVRMSVSLTADPKLVSRTKLDRMVDRVKPWFMVHGLAHGS